MHVSVDHINLSQIADSGQCFRFEKLADGSYRVIAYGLSALLKQEADGINIDCSQKEWDEVWKLYFDLSTDYNQVETLVKESKDAHLNEAFSVGSGIRILKQDLWEMIVSFLISQNNNIPRIKKSIEAICERGDLRPYNSETGYRFPGPSELDVSIFDDASLGLGYRNVYLKEIYEFAKSNPDWLDSLKTMPYEDARAELLKRKGIGPKVADCICLFGLHHVEAFPIDTHIKQLLNKYYPNGFNHDFFKGYAGIIQQYLFYYEIK